MNPPRLCPSPLICPPPLPGCAYTPEDPLPAVSAPSVTAPAQPVPTQPSTQPSTQNPTQPPSEPAVLPSEAPVTSLLTSPGDIALTDPDGSGYAYTFTYDGETFEAFYTQDNWKIRDSYRITDAADITLICEALRAAHPIHTADYTDYRTAGDMAYEWVQHNLAYQLLPDDSPWKDSVRDVDIDPPDQGKSVLDFYRERTG